MAALLTKASRITREQKRISQLTEDHEAYFKVIFSHQVESPYNFRSIHSHEGDNTTVHDKCKMLTALGKFLDDSTKLTITEVEKTYERTPDTRDASYDPETKQPVEIQHFCLFDGTAKADRVQDGVRLHGYFRTNGGYFVVTRLDWFHDFHAN